MQKVPQIIETDLNCEQVSPAVAERNLLASMISRAICDAFSTAQVEPHIRREAKHWLFCDLLPEKPFTLAWTAIQLGIDPTMFQEQLRAQVNDPEALANKLQILRS